MDSPRPNTSSGWETLYWHVVAAMLLSEWKISNNNNTANFSFGCISQVDGMNRFVSVLSGTLSTTLKMSVMSSGLFQTPPEDDSRMVTGNRQRRQQASQETTRLRFYHLNFPDIHQFHIKC
ncbi:uncharacterized protein V6R79_025543 [Siganus canaliculatus]